MSKNVTIQNNFQGGLKSEFTGLNFPENAATAASNVIFTHMGDVVRRNGVNYETNYTTLTASTTNVAINSYKWNNVGGDGQTQIVVEQVGSNIYFYLSSSATVSNPLSTQLLASTVTLTAVSGSPNNPSTVECQFADGNGYLFIYHPYCDPVYCVYNSTTQNITANTVVLYVRDFTGVVDGLATTTRPPSNSNEHLYNLENQGWTTGAAWTGSSSSTVTYQTGSTTFALSSESSTSVTNGDFITVTNSLYGAFTASGTVTSYSAGVSVTINITSLGYPLGSGSNLSGWSLVKTTAAGYLTTWYSAEGNYPSNADVWWAFKDSTNTFNPSTTVPQVTLSTAPAPMGHYILQAFNQNRSALSGVTGLTTVLTYVRPKTGCWFQGRIWYTGIDSSFLSSGDEPFQTWTENIYFSQIIENTSQFGYCYQVNDPTSETLFAELSTDGGVITIQGAGSIYKLFPVENGLLVFAANGIWFLTGSIGVGFSPIDYTITKLSSVQSISSTSFVDVLGYPYFWNEEGIYSVIPEDSTSGRAIPTVKNIVLQNIQPTYAAIPLQSKKYARGSYNPVTFTLEWIYRSSNETSITSRYQFDSALCQNQINKAFYPYLFSNNGSTSPFVHGILYVSGPGGSTSPNPVFKYFCGTSSIITFAEENDNVNWVDWYSVDSIGVNYISTFTTGFNIHGKAAFRWQPEYVYVYSNNVTNTAYTIQGVWDYALNINSGKISTRQITTNGQTVFINPFFGNIFRRHRIRGRGIVFQLKITSVQGQPFDILGWALAETINDWT